MKASMLKSISLKPQIYNNNLKNADSTNFQIAQSYNLNDDSFQKASDVSFTGFKNPLNIDLFGHFNEKRTVAKIQRELDIEAIKAKGASDKLAESIMNKDIREIIRWITKPNDKNPLYSRVLTEGTYESGSPFEPIEKQAQLALEELTNLISSPGTSKRDLIYTLNQIIEGKKLKEARKSIDHSTFIQIPESIIQSLKQKVL